MSSPLILGTWGMLLWWPRVQPKVIIVHPKGFYNGEGTRLWTLTDLDCGKLCISMHHPHKMSSTRDKLVKFGLNVCNVLLWLWAKFWNVCVYGLLLLFKTTHYVAFYWSLNFIVFGTGSSKQKAQVYYCVCSDVTVQFIWHRVIKSESLSVSYNVVMRLFSLLGTG